MQKKNNDKKINVFRAWRNKCDMDEWTNAGEVNRRKYIYEK
jgi:hypothetical protein